MSGAVKLSRRNFVASLLGAMTAVAALPKEALGANALAVLAGTKTAPRVIFDTDFAGDCDDTADLAMLMALDKLGLIRLIGVAVSSKSSGYTRSAVKACLTYGKFRTIPVFGGDSGFVGAAGSTWSQGVALEFGPGADNGSDDSGAVGYRKLLAQSPDGSVIIVMSGYAAAVTALLQSAADSYGPAGPQFIQQKVRFAGWEAGWMANQYAPQNGHAAITTAEPNISGSLVSAQNLLTLWPTTVPFIWNGDEQFTGVTIAVPSTALPSISPYANAAELFNDSAAPVSSNGYVVPLILYAAGFTNWWEPRVPAGSMTISSATTPTLSISNTSKNVTLVSGAVSDGQLIAGTGIPASTFIDSVNGAALTMTNAATATNASLAATGSSGMTKWNSAAGPFRYFSTKSFGAAQQTAATAFVGQLIAQIAGGPSDAQAALDFTGAVSWIDFSGDGSASVITGSGASFAASDLSGNGNTFTIPSWGAAPTIVAAQLNALSVARFDGATVAGQLGADGASGFASGWNSGAVGLHVFMILKPRSVAAEQRFFDLGPVASSSSHILNRFYLGVHDSSVTKYRGGRVGSGNSQPTGKPTFNTSTWYVLEQFYDPSHPDDGTRNGQAYNGIGPQLAINNGATIPNGVSKILSLTNCRVGGEETATDAGHLFANMDLVAIAVFQGRRTLAQTRGHYHYIQNRWGITLPW